MPMRTFFLRNGLARLFGETSGRAGQDRVRPETNRLVEQTRTENLFFGAPTLERDHAVARASLDGSDFELLREYPNNEGGGFALFLR